MDDEDDIKREHDVMRIELDSLLRIEAPKVCKFLNEYADFILKHLTTSDLFESSVKTAQKIEKVNLVANNGLEGIKCSLGISANELRNIEIHYKPSIRHNNYIYKSKEESPWNLYQISNCADILKSILIYLENISFKSLDQVVLHIDHLIESINSARNVLLFPKKRSIQELQTQKNMKIFPLVPNELVFSFYIQGFTLILAIYILKGNESTKHVLECSNINWLNNVMILLTTCLLKLQQMKDKLSLFEQLNIYE